METVRAPKLLKALVLLEQHSLSTSCDDRRVLCPHCPLQQPSALEVWLCGQGTELCVLVSCRLSWSSPCG